MKEVTEYDNVRFTNPEKDPEKRIALAEKAKKDMELFRKRMEKKYGKLRED